MVDYSKWEKIQLSDDEDDTYSPSLSHSQREAQIQRLADLEREKEDLIQNKQSYQERLKAAKERLRKKEGNEADLKKELVNLAEEGKDLQRFEEDLIKEERALWAVDADSKPDDELAVAEARENMKKFVEENKELCDKYGSLCENADSQCFLQQNPKLICGNAVNYLITRSIKLHLKDEKDKLAVTAFQCISLKRILDLVQQLDIDPQECVALFFYNLENYASDYKERISYEIDALKEFVQIKAQESVEKAMEQMGRQACYPEELLESCETCDVDTIQEEITSSTIEEAKCHEDPCLLEPNVVNDEADHAKPIGAAKYAAADEEEDYEYESDETVGAQSDETMCSDDSTVSDNDIAIGADSEEDMGVETDDSDEEVNMKKIEEIEESNYKPIDFDEVD